MFAQPTIDEAFPAHTEQAAKNPDLSHLSRARHWDGPSTYSRSRLERSFQTAQIGMIVGLTGAVATFAVVLDELSSNSRYYRDDYSDRTLYSNLWERPDYVVATLVGQAGHVMWGAGTLIGANELRRAGYDVPRTGGIVAVIGGASGAYPLTWIGSPIQMSINRRAAAQLAGEQAPGLTWAAGPQQMGAGQGLGFSMSW